MTEVTPDLMKQHLEQVIATYKDNGLLYGSADFVCDQDSEQTKLAFACFVTIVEKLGCMPYSVHKEEVTKKKSLLEVDTKGPPEMAIRYRLFFRINTMETETLDS